MTQKLADKIRQGLADCLEVFEHVAPKSERTLIRHRFKMEGYSFINDLGVPCDYRIVNPSGKEIGAIRYYRGRVLSCYDIVRPE